MGKYKIFFEGYREGFLENLWYLYVDFKYVERSDK